MVDLVNVGLRVDSRDVKNASEDLKNLGSSGEKASKSTDKLKKSFANLSRQSSAYTELQIRSDREIRREAQKVIASYNRLKESGKLSKTELARASAAAKKRIRELKVELSGTTKASNGLASSFKQLAVISAVTLGIRAAINAHREFTKSISELSAITGAAGNDLKFYKRQAMELGSTTTFSASQVAEAFKLVASAKPDLLSSKEALASVTNEVLTLAEASGMQLPDAAKALGGALNQFGAGAESASRYINVLAAGSKLGASEINNTSEALKNVGAVASSVGLSFEETNAAIQTLASVSIKGAEAGTGLRGVFLKLADQSNAKFNPEIVGLEQAMLNLRDANLSTTEKMELFGQESITAATALIEQADKVGELTKALTGTDTAYKQARINTDNLDGDVKSMSSAWEGAALILGETFNPAIRFSVQLLTDAGKIVSSLSIALSDMGDALGAYVAAAVSAASFEFDQAKEILSIREQVREENQKRIDKIWEEKDAIEQKAEVEKKTIAAVEEAKQEAAAMEAERAVAAQEEEQEDPMEKLLRQAELDEMELERASEHKQRMLEVNMDYYDRLYNLQAGSQQAALDFTNAVRTMDLRGAIEHGSLMLSNLAKTNKTMFKVQKAFALANAIVTLPSAVIKSFENGGGYPWGLIPAGLMLATGLQQINQIKSATFGGGGTPSAPTGGGGGRAQGTGQGAPVASGLPEGSTAVRDGEERQTKEVRVTFEGDNPHSEAMRNFASTLSETLRDMGSDVDLAVTR